MAIISVDFDEVDQLIITYFIFFRYCRRNGSTMGQYRPRKDQVRYCGNNRTKSGLYSQRN